MHSRISPRLALLLGAALFSGTALASGESRLRDFLSNVTSLTATFTQQQDDNTGAPPESASGTLHLMQPGRFRWDYRQPYEQLIVADGNRLWVYDADLEQVTVRDMAEALGNSPARLLSGELDLDRDFTILDQPRRDGLEWIELKPNDAQEEFSVMRLGFAPRELRAMEMTDNLGQSTVITFSKMQVNPKLDSSLFVFVPPPGVDVIGE